MKLDKIACDFSYKEVKADTLTYLNSYYKGSQVRIKSEPYKNLYKDAIDMTVCDYYSLREYETIEENGIECAYIFIVGCLWLININKKHEKLAYKTLNIIKDLKSGEYANLILNEDKEELFEDIKIVYCHLVKEYAFKVEDESF